MLAVLVDQVIPVLMALAGQVALLAQRVMLVRQALLVIPALMVLVVQVALLAQRVMLVR
jgi:hypothetical protein